MENKKITLLILFLNSQIYSMNIQIDQKKNDEHTNLICSEKKSFGTMPHLINAIQINFNNEMRCRKMFFDDQEKLAEQEKQLFEQKKLGLFVSIGLQKITHKSRISAWRCQQLLMSEPYQQVGKRNNSYVLLIKAMNNEKVEQSEVESSLMQINADLNWLKEKRRHMEKCYYWQLFLVNCFPLFCFGSAMCCLPCIL